MKLLLYCTKAKPYLVYGCTNKYTMSYGYDVTYSEEIKNNLDCFNGKIVGECDFEVSEIEFKQAFYLNGPLYITKRKEPFKYFSYIDLLKESCLQDNEMLKYLGNKNGKAIHIKNLHVFDEPKELSEYSKNVEHCKCDECLENCKKYCKYYYAKNNITQTINTGCIKYALLYKAPQNMMYVFDNEEKKILISIRPEWLCKILNGEKTIEVRKKVLKEM